MNVFVVFVVAVMLTEAKAAQEDTLGREDGASYTCSAGHYCSDRYTDSIRKRFDEIEEDCKSDSRCKAFDYSDDFKYGHLCSTTNTTNLDYYATCFNLGVLVPSYSKLASQHCI